MLPVAGQDHSGDSYREGLQEARSHADIRGSNSLLQIVGYKIPFYMLDMLDKMEFWICCSNFSLDIKSHKMNNFSSICWIKWSCLDKT